MSLLKVNEVQNYNGSSLTLTASTVSTSAQLNTGGNISVTGSLNVSDDSTTRSNLGLGSIATQDSDNVSVTGGTATLGALTVSGSDSGDLVRITQTGSGNALVVEDSANPDSTPFVVDASGNLLVGTTVSRNAKLNIKQTIAEAIIDINHTNPGTQYFQYFVYNGSVIGTILGNNTSTSYNTSSDYRLKENITEITDGISRVKQLNPSRFNFIADPENIVDGFIAHEVQDIVPEAVSGEKDAVNEDGSINPQGIDQSKLVPLLTAALQESIALIESQQSQIDALTARIEALETA
jgi:hypothetical protein